MPINSELKNQSITEELKALICIYTVIVMNLNPAKYNTFINLWLCNLFLWRPSPVDKVNESLQSCKVGTK